jgi:CRISPR system Cascade subunit CasB
MPDLDREPWIGLFITNLERLLGKGNAGHDAGTLAKLRRGLTEHQAERDMWVFAHLAGAAPEHEEFALLIASLFALWHQGGRGLVRRPADSFGGSYGRLRTADGSESLEKRFAALIDSHPDDLPDRLRHGVTLLRSKDISINWKNLLRDLLGWSGDKRLVQRRWARDFWTATRNANAESAKNITQPE